MNDDKVVWAVREGAMEISLNRPDVRNALTPDMFGMLVQALDEASSCRESRIVILAGTGLSFCSGGDANYEAQSLDYAWHQMTLLVQTLESFPKPVVAKVHGHAIGFGCSLALLADFVIAEQNTLFQFPFVQMGLVPEGIALVTRLTTTAVARSFLLLGEPLDGTEAQAVGLIHKSVPKEDFDAEVEDLRKQLLALPGHAYRLIKEGLKLSMTASLEQTLAWEGEMQRSIRSSPEFTEFRKQFFRNAGVKVNTD